MVETAQQPAGWWILATGVKILISNLMNLFFFQSRNTMAQKTNTSRFGELLKTSCHELHYTRSCGLKQFVDYSEDTQTVYLWRAGLLELHGENMTIFWHHEQVLGNVIERHATKCCGILKIHRRKTQGSKRSPSIWRSNFKQKISMFNQVTCFAVNA